MRIEAIDLIHISIPLVSPFRISRGVISDRHMLLVRLHSEGAFGWAEAGADLLPLYTYETVGTVRHVIADLFAEEILARNWPEEGSAHAVAEHHGKWPWHPMAKAAIAQMSANAQPVARGGQSMDIANAVAFLASEDAGFVTGTSLLVDGGLTVGPRHSWDPEEPGLLASLEAMEAQAREAQKAP